MTEGFMSLEIHASWPEVEAPIDGEIPEADIHLSFTAEYSLGAAGQLVTATIIGSYIDEETEAVQWERPGYLREHRVTLRANELELSWGTEGEGTNRMMRAATNGAPAHARHLRRGQGPGGPRQPARPLRSSYPAWLRRARRLRAREARRGGRGGRFPADRQGTRRRRPLISPRTRQGAHRWCAAPLVAFVSRVRSALREAARSAPLLAALFGHEVPDPAVGAA